MWALPLPLPVEEAAAQGLGELAVYAAGMAPAMAKSSSSPSNLVVWRAAVSSSRSIIINLAGARGGGKMRQLGGGRESKGRKGATF